jgi:alpha-beta hydrolase superfamily lysophospholipase
MGAATLAKLLTRGVTPKPIRAAVLSAPSLEIPRTPIVQIKIVVGRLIARVLPTLTVDAGVNPAAISHDPDRVRAYREDPMVLRKISARLGKSLIDDTDAIIASASRISIPLLVYHGTDDAIASIGGTRRFVQNAPANLVEYREAEGFFHEVHNERRDWAAPFMTGVADWIAQQAGLHPLTADAKSVDG